MSDAITPYNGTALVPATPEALQPQQVDVTIIEQAMVVGDLAKLTPAQRLQFYRAVCGAVGLNPLTQPFTPLKRQDGTLWLYANATCAEQLRKLHRVSSRILARTTEQMGDEALYRVEVEASTPEGRCYQTQAVVSLTKPKRKITGKWPSGDPKYSDVVDEDGSPVLVPLRGVELSNAFMRADAKAHRRATLGLIGLGWLDVDWDGRPAGLNLQTGEVVEEAPVRVPQPRAHLTPLEARDTMDALYGPGPGTPTPPVPAPAPEPEEPEEELPF